MLFFPSNTFLSLMHTYTLTENTDALTANIVTDLVYLEGVTKHVLSDWRGFNLS